MIVLIGNESEDVTIYLATILRFLSVRVVVIEVEKNETIPSTSSMSQESWKNQIEQHRGIDYLFGKEMIQILFEFQEDIRKEYDVILLRGNESVPTEWIIKCDKLICCMDFRKTELERLEEIALCRIPDVIMLRNIIPCKIKPNYILRPYRRGSTGVKIVLVPFQKKDLKYKLENEYHQRIRFSHLSRDLRKGILEIVEILVPELKKSERNRVYRGAGKGK